MDTAQSTGRNSPSSPIADCPLDRNNASLEEVVLCDDGSSELTRSDANSVGLHHESNLKGFYCAKEN